MHGPALQVARALDITTSTTVTATTSQTATDSLYIKGNGDYNLLVAEGVTYTYKDRTAATGNYGGAIRLDGVNAKLTIGGAGWDGWTIFEGDRANNGGGAIGSYTNSGPGSTVVLHNVRFGAPDDPLGVLGNSSGGQGGAIYIRTGTVRITNGLFYNNKATTDGGGIASVSNGTTDLMLVSATMIGNSAGGRGGALFGSQGVTNNKLTITGSHLLFQGNTAISDAAASFGGALAFASSQSNRDIAVNLYNAVFRNNLAGNGGGGGLYFTAGSARIMVFLEDAVFDGNYATTSGATWAGMGGAIHAVAGGASVNVETITLNDPSFTNNHADIAGGALFLRSTNVLFNITRDALYAGNWAGSTGADGADAGAGGFMRIWDGAPTVAFEIDSGKTVTIGVAANPDHDTLTSGAQNASLLGLNISGSAGKAGTLVLHGDSASFSAVTEIGAGRLLLGNAAAALGGSITVRAGGTFGGWGTAAATGGTPGVLVQSGGALQVGADDAADAAQTLSFNGALTLENNTVISGDGVLDIAGASSVSLGSAPADVVRVSAAASKKIIIDGALSGAAALQKEGAGTLTLANANNINGLRLADGAVELGDNNSIGAGALAVSGTDSTVRFIAAGLALANTITLDGRATFDTGANAATLSGPLSGAGGFSKTGSGKLTLAGGVTHTGATDILGGTLAADINSSAAITIANQSTLEGGLTRGAGQSLTASGTITGALTLNDAASLGFDLGNNDAAQLTVAGALTASGITNVNLTNLGNDTRTLISAASLSGNTGNFTYTVDGGAITNRDTVSLFVDGNNLMLASTVRSLRMIWTGANGDTWDTTDTHWTDNGATPETRFHDGDSVLFGPDASGTITIADGGVIAGDIEADTAGALTFTGATITTDANAASIDGAAGYVYLGGSGSAAATGKFVKKGAGSLTFANEANTFGAGLEINQGAVSFNNAAQLGASGPGVLFTGNSTLRADGDILDATGTISAAITISPGITATFDTQNFTVTHNAAINGAATASLVKTGPGSLVLRATDNSGFLGDTTVGQGTLLLAGSAKLGGDVTIARGAIAGGAGTFTGAVAVADGGILRAGAGGASGASPGTLAIDGSLTLTGSARVNFNIYGTGQNDILNVAGPLEIATPSNIVSLYFRVIASGTYVLGNATGLAGVQTLMVNNTVVDPTLRAHNELDVSGANLVFIYGADDSRYMEWTGASGADNWNIGLDNWQGYNGDTGGKTKFQDGDTVRFATTANTTITIDADVAVSGMEVDNTGTLTFAGQSITADTDITGALITAPTARLDKSGEGTLVFDNTANNFTGGIRLGAGVIAFSTAAQLGATGTSIDFTGSGTLRALAPGIVLSGTLRLADGALGAFDTGANDTTLSGALLGTGTLVKIGSGALTYSGAASGAALLGADATTRIDTGYVLLRDFSAADIPALSHNFILNGGWLDLSDSPGFHRDAPDDSTANDWSSLNITGTLGGVIGGNDKITLRDGDIISGIGDPGDEHKQGVYVVVDADADGVATMTGSNSYAGYTILRSGTLRITSDGQLGLGELNREIRFTGGALEIAASETPFESTRAIGLRADAIIGVTGSQATLGGDIIETSAGLGLTKTGTGLLILTGTNHYTGLTTIREGSLQVNTRSLPGDVLNDGTLIFEETTSAVHDGNINGAGRLVKTGPAGTLSLAGAYDYSGDTIVAEGTLKAARANTFSPNSTHRTNPGGTLDLNSLDHTVKALVNDGVLMFSATVNSGVGTIIQANRLTVTESVSGTGTLRVALVEADPSVTTGTNAFAIITSNDAGDADFSMEFVGSQGGLYTWDVQKQGGDYILQSGRVAPVIPAVAGIDAAVLLSTQAAMDSLGQRLASMRIADGNAGRKGFDVWANGVYRYDEISDTLYDGTHANTEGVQAGVDITDKNSAFTLGAFADYITTDMSMPDDAKTRTKMTGYGVYATYRPGAWYVDVLLRGNKSTYTITLPQTPDFDMDASGFGVGATYGMVVKTFSGWRLEPQAQLAWSFTNVDDTLDTYTRKYTVDNPQSLRTSLGAQLSKLFVLRAGWNLRAYARASYIQEFDAKTRVEVIKYSSDQTRVLDRYDYEEDLGGASAALAAGAVLRIAGRLDVWSDITGNLGGKMSSFSVNIGAGYHW